MGKDVEPGCCSACRLYGDPLKVPPAPPPGPPLALTPDQVKIVVTCRGQPYAEVLPTGPRVIVGRGAGADVVLRDGAISRMQCAFELGDDGVCLRDLGSACGTYVDGAKVEVARLNERSTVAMAEFVLRVVPR
ncbi:MAG: FHA domain-containing protein [Acidobacteriota bacterium]